MDDGSIDDRDEGYEGVDMSWLWVFIWHDDIVGSDVDTICAEEIGVKVAQASWFISALLSSWSYNTDESRGMKDGDGKEDDNDRGAMDDVWDRGDRESDEAGNSDGDGDSNVMGDVWLTIVRGGGVLINVVWSASYVDVDTVISLDVISADMFNKELGWVARVLVSLEITWSSSTDNEDLEGDGDDGQVEADDTGDGGQDGLMLFLYAGAGLTCFGLMDMIGV